MPNFENMLNSTPSVHCTCFIILHKYLARVVRIILCMTCTICLVVFTNYSYYNICCIAGIEIWCGLCYILILGLWVYEDSREAPLFDGSQIRTHAPWSNDQWFVLRSDTWSMSHHVACKGRHFVFLVIISITHMFVVTWCYLLLEEFQHNNGV